MNDKKTALYDTHVALGAKMVPFAGFIMPIQYSGIIDEHLAVRRQVGVFDVSHMGEFDLRGGDAVTFLNRVTTNNVAKLEPGQIQYSTMLQDDGGIVDDLLVYRFDDHLMVVVNAVNLDKDYMWIEEHLEGDVQLTDISDGITLLAVQGPRGEELVAELADREIRDVTYYNFREGKVAGVTAVISRTGYTGEDGFELYVNRRDSQQLWDGLQEKGRPLGLKPIGLGARDSLRLEVAYCLYGNDIDQTTNPIEAGLGWIVKSKKFGGFIGKEPVLKAKEGTTRKLVGFTMKDKAIPRHGFEIIINGAKVGYVTSGGFSPALDKFIGLGYVDKPHHETGNSIDIIIRGKPVAAEIVDTPFYKRPS